MRGPLERADLDRAIADLDPDVILVDTNSYGATVAAQRAARRGGGDPWVLVTTSTDYQADEALARVERFVPHGPVLECAAAVVCHSGMGIVQKSVAAGVPIAAVPFGRDQPEVARRGCGLRRRRAARGRGRWSSCRVTRLRT